MTSQVCGGIPQQSEHWALAQTKYDAKYRCGMLRVVTNYICILQRICVLSQCFPSCNVSYILVAPCIPIQSLSLTLLMITQQLFILQYTPVCSVPLKCDTKSATQFTTITIRYPSTVSMSHVHHSTLYENLLRHFSCTPESQVCSNLVRMFEHMRQSPVYVWIVYDLVQ